MSRATNQQIAAGFSKGLQGFAIGLAERQKKEQNQKKLQNVVEQVKQGNLSATQEAALIAGLDKEQQGPLLVTLKEKAKREAEGSAINDLKNRRPDLFPELATAGGGKTTNVENPPVNVGNPAITPEGVPQANLIKPEQLLNPGQNRMLLNEEMGQAFNGAPGSLPAPTGAVAPPVPEAAPAQVSAAPKRLTYDQRQQRITELTNKGLNRQAQLEEKQLEFDQRQDIANAQLKVAKDKLVLPIQAKAIERLHSSEDTLFAFKNQLAEIDAGNVDVWSKANLSNFLEKAGYPTLSAAAQSQGGAVFNTAKKQIFAGARNIFGAKVSDRETALYDTMQAATGRNKEANRATVFTLMVPQLRDNEDARYTLQVIDENPDIDALKIRNLVNNHMKGYTDNLRKQWEDYIDKAKGSIKSEKQVLGETKKRRSLGEIIK